MCLKIVLREEEFKSFPLVKCLTGDKQKEAFLTELVNEQMNKQISEERKERIREQTALCARINGVLEFIKTGCHP